MAGTFGVTGDGPAGHPVPAAYLAGFRQVRHVSPDYFTREELVGLHPDFLFAGWNYGLEAGTSLTPPALAQFGIKTLALTESCAHVPGRASTRSASTTPTPTCATSARSSTSAPGPAGHRGHAGPGSRRARQGGRAQAGHRLRLRQRPGRPVHRRGPGHAQRADQPRRRHQHLRRAQAELDLGVLGAGRQQADPQCIIINDYGTPTAAQKEKFLETSPITRNLTAVRNNCFLPLAYDEVTPGPRNAQAVTGDRPLAAPGGF